MAKFTESEWNKINRLLDTNGDEFGFPRRRGDSVVLASFNIRKIGQQKNKSAGAWRFLHRFCARCDLVAVQEVQDNLEGLDHLKSLLGGGYGMVVSDITGGIAGKRGMVERLAFLYRRNRVARTEVASDITIDRSAVLDTLYEKRGDFLKAFQDRQKELTAWKRKYNGKLDDWKIRVDAWEAGGRPGRKPKKPGPSRPPFVLPHFLTFIRTPHCVSFEVPGRPRRKPYRFLAVNAHLLYGHRDRQAQERRMEFFGLIGWLVARARQAKRMYHKDIIMFGDLNLDFDQPVSDREEIEDGLRSLNRGQLRGTSRAKVNFPFLDVHPSRKKIEEAEGTQAAIFRTNPRMNQTYDQIALFIDDERLPNHDMNRRAGKTEGGFDYRVFDFVELFAQAIHGKAFEELSKTASGALIGKFEHDVSDHMPIWIRLPLP